MNDHRLDIEAIKSSGHFDIHLTSECQHACSYCNTTLSSKWVSDEEKYGKYRVFRIAEEAHGNSPSDVDEFWQTWYSVYPYLNSIRINGGEPTLDINTLKILEYIEAFPIPDMKIEVLSNFDVDPTTYYRYMEVVHRLGILNKVMFNQVVSIDSGESGHVWYVRDKVDAARAFGRAQHYLHNTPESFSLTIAPTVAAITVVGLPSLLEWVLYARRLMNRESNRVYLRASTLVSPSWQSVSILPMEYAGRLEDLITWMYANYDETALRGFSEDDISQIDSALDTIKDAQNLPEDHVHRQRATFYEFFTEYDRRRTPAAKLTRSIPEMSAFWKECEYHFLRLR